MKDLINQYFNKESKLIKQIDRQTLLFVAKIIRNALCAYKKIYVIGNGGSASTATHMCNDFILSGIKATCLNDNISVLTAISNDKAYTDVFAYQVQLYLQKGDILIGFSTSGNSANICNALIAARQKGSIAISITGLQGGRMKALSDHHIEVPSCDTQIIEDLHLAISHILVFMTTELPEQRISS